MYCLGKPGAAAANGGPDIRRRQAIWEMDMELWTELVQLLNIKEPIIPHREEEERPVGPGTWYH